MTENRARRGNANKSLLLVADLGDRDEKKRVSARESLVAMGKPAVEALVKALADKNKIVRLEASKALNKMDLPWSEKADASVINALISDLNSDDGFVRSLARKSLVAIGSDSVEPLIDALGSNKQMVRWEAAKALGQIADPNATEALVNALRDEMFDVRWLAAVALCLIGEPALLPLLNTLVKNADSLYLREGAHHVFHDMRKAKTRKILRPVLTALEGPEPTLEVPLAASTAIKALSA